MVIGKQIGPEPFHANRPGVRGDAENEQRADPLALILVGNGESDLGRTRVGWDSVVPTDTDQVPFDHCNEGHVVPVVEFGVCLEFVGLEFSLDTEEPEVAALRRHV